VFLTVENAPISGFIFERSCDLHCLRALNNLIKQERAYALKREFYKGNKMITRFVRKMA
jgi:hypothetical protein